MVVSPICMSAKNGKTNIKQYSAFHVSFRIETLFYQSNVYFGQTVSLVCGVVSYDSRDVDWYQVYTDQGLHWCHSKLLRLDVLYTSADRSKSTESICPMQKIKQHAQLTSSLRTRNQLVQCRRYFEANKDRSYTHGVRHLNCYGTDISVSSFASHLNTGFVVCCQN